MIRNFSTRLLLNGQGLTTLNRLLSTQEKSQLEFSTNDFPLENGFEQNSLYGNELVLPSCSLDQYVWQNFYRWQNHVATVCGATNRQYTFAQMRDNSAALAVRLQTKFKLNFKDCIAVCLPNIPEFPIAVLGAIEAGLLVTTVNPIYTAEEISRQLINSEAKYVITTCAGHSTMVEALKLAKLNMPIVCVKMEKDNVLPENAVSFEEIMSPEGVNFSDFVKHESKPHDIVFRPYSSGTTGLPKGVDLSHLNIIANSQQLQANTGPKPLIEPTTATNQDVLPCVLPFFHIYGLTVTMLAKLHLGCKLVTLPSFRPDTFLDSLSVHKGNVLHLVPPIVLFMGGSDKVGHKHLEHVKYVMSGAAPIGELDAKRLTRKAPQIKFIQGYGLTETSPVVMMGVLGGTNYASVGSPPPITQAKIVQLGDKTFTALGPNQTGELLVCGPQVMKGYYKNPEATKDCIIDGGWFRTGDIAHYDENLQFYITDRLKELIKVKGFQVAPAELEEIIRDHPKVDDAAVIGVPHTCNGESPRAFVVKKPNEEVTEKEIQDFVAAKVAVYKKLEGGVVFLETIPKNASGKILRRKLKEDFC